uniref:Uncharacterized protein n=1 Tax=Brassica oleracea var. oleracea TaxID=109376 RepID=A0A0D3DXW4_BRAOL
MEVMWIADPLLCAVIVQLMGICWAISLVRQLEFLLKKNNKMPIDKHLSIQAPMMCNVVKIVNQELGERSLEKPDLFLDSAPRLSHSWIQMAGK